MKWRNILLSSALSLMGFVLFSVPAYAATIDTVQFRVLNPNDEIVPNVPVDLYDDAGNAINFGTSNESGFVNYFDVDEGDYVLHVEPGNAFDCSACALYESQEVDVTVSEDDATDFFGQSLVTLDDVELEQGANILTITVTDQNGDPASNVWVSGWAYEATEGGWFDVQTDSDGIGLVAVPATGMWSVNTWSEEFSDVFVEQVVIEEGENELDITVQSYDATINVSLVNEDDSAYTLGDSQWGSVSCSNDEWTVYTWGDVQSGESTTTMSAIGGETYTCSFWTEGAGASPVTFDLEEGATADIEIEMLSYDAPVEISLVAEGTGDVLTDISSFDYYAYSVLDADGQEYWDDYHWGFGSSGTSGEFNVLNGVTYEAGAYIVNDADQVEFEEVSFGSMGVRATAEGAQYIQNYDMHQFVADSDELTSVEIELAEADAYIEVTITNSDGAWIHAEEVVEDGWGAYVGDDTGFDGTVTLAVQSGKTYEVFAYPYDAWDGNKMPPASQEVTPEEGETVELEMAAVEVDYTINITTEVEDGVEEPDFVWCYAFGEGTENMVDFEGGSQGSLGWLSDTEANIGCMGYSENTFLRTEGETRIAAGASDGETDVTLTLGDFGEWYDEKSYTFDGTTTTEIELPDGSIMTIPALVEEGTLTLTAGTASNMTASEDNYAIEGWDYEIRDGDGNLIEEFDTNITIRMHYDEAILEELGIDEETLIAKSQGDNNEWTNAASFEVDTENNIVTVSVSHFSTYAILGNKEQSSTGTTKEELLGVSNIEKKANQTVTVTYESGDERTFQVFDNGTAKAKAQLHTNGDVLIAINKTYMRTFDVYSGEQLDQVKLFKKKQAHTKFKRMNVFKKKAGQNNVMVVARTKSSQKKKLKLRSYVVKNGGNITRRKVQNITLDEPINKFKNVGVKKNKKFGANARVMITKKGKKIEGLDTYSVTKKKGILKPVTY